MEKVRRLEKTPPQRLLDDASGGPFNVTTLTRWDDADEIAAYHAVDLA